ncbi:hypothetical protein AMTR_s00019p00194970 [Amborella trichopoda]|uniref:Thioredoxin-like protein 4B n=1 Tax=Amborella trichopoda TaxID=13333 RepID=W1PI11_AMBTC|nr:hypothetical protein AMTR_s00019p00194970 [Amborella trichopoda]
MSFLLNTLSKKRKVDSIIRDTLDKVLVLRFGRPSDPACLQLDNILAKSAREVLKFATIALVDIDSDDIQVYVKYFDITLVPSTVFFFNAHHMKMDSGTADHTKWIGTFNEKQDFIDVVETPMTVAACGNLVLGLVDHYHREEGGLDGDKEMVKVEGQEHYRLGVFSRCGVEGQERYRLGVFHVVELRAKSAIN